MDTSTLEQTTPPIALGDNPPVAPLAVGTWAWGDKLVWGYGKSYDQNDLKAAYDASLAAGVQLFDTAELYGPHTSERLLGEFMRPSQNPPQIASKFFPYPWRFSKGQFAKALRASLQRLGAESMALYQVHWPFPPRPLETWLEAMVDAHQQGLIRAIGVSNYSVEQMERAQKVLEPHGLRLVSNQVKYSLLARDPERNGVLAACRDMGVTLLAYSPLAQGLLTAKYSPENPPPRLRSQGFHGKMEQLEPLMQALRDIGSSQQKTPAQVALNWLLMQGVIVLPGAKNAQQAEQNAGALGWRLSEEDQAKLSALTAERA